jgi:hypothetical protein
MSDNHDRGQEPEDGEREPGDGEFCGGTFLYIRDHPADDGSVPLPAALEHWLSPDITVIQPNGARGGEAVAGQVNQIEVIVTNACGVTAIDAYVDAFVANPATGFTPATATLIGGGYLTVPSYNTAAITFPWTPSASEAGHRCLLARVSLLIPPDTYLDGTIFDVRGDRHVAQRNIHVVALAPQDMNLKFAFGIANTTLEAMTAIVLAEEVRDARQLAQIRAALGCQFAQVGETPLRDVGLVVEQEPRMVAALVAATARIGTPTLGLRPRAGRLTNAITTDRQPVIQLDLEPGEVRQAVLYVGRNRETRPGDLHVVAIRQLDQREQLQGGLAVIVVH